MTQKAALMWTGGKDCCLALTRCQEEGIDVQLLVTFTPTSDFQFHAHPQSIMKKQAESMGISHMFFQIPEPMESGFENAFTDIKDMGYELIITGDISEVHKCQNWVTERAKGIIDVYHPLWHNDREAMVQEMFDKEIRCYLSCVYKDHLPLTFLAREYDPRTLKELNILNQHIGHREPVDLCGENGEFHTMVFDAPFFSYPLEIPMQVIEEESYYRLLYRTEKKECSSGTRDKSNCCN